METMKDYLRRKHEELQLLDGCLDEPFAPPTPKSIDEVIAVKFKLTAAIRAQHDLKGWTTTETAWSHRKKSSDSPFEFRYDYQRADLDVTGPSFYDLGNDFECETIYTSSGMASISALLLASSHVFDRADVVVLPGTYGETLEFIEGFAPHLQITPAGRIPSRAVSGSSYRILFLDSCALAKDFEACLKPHWAQFALCIFDSSCLNGGSGKIRRALRKARRDGVPVAMVRSHTKLDSLGAEYGRLGSTTFVRSPEDDLWVRSRLRNLPDEMRNAVRLLGGAALPAHFPPYVGSLEYRSLTTRRDAAIIRNGRRTARVFRKELGDLVEQTNFTHGQYVLLRTRRTLDEAEASHSASRMSCDLGRRGLPIRHAGSFGFDFAATEWFHDMTTGEFSVRVAVADIPTRVWDELTLAIARWWVEYASRK